MKTRPYLEQEKHWPQSGRHILARYDAESIHVYQAYRPAIANFASLNQRFGGEFSYSRMSWIKPNFLWMMYRAGWATKEGQEHILAVRLPRTLFDDLLRQGVPSTFDPDRYGSREEWQAAVASSDVRLQWDPDHDPAGRPLQRRAVQLGLRGRALRRYAEEEVLSIEDITPFVAEQREHVANLHALQTPEEHIYVPDPQAAHAAGVEVHGA